MHVYRMDVCVSDRVTLALLLMPIAMQQKIIRQVAMSGGKQSAGEDQ